MERVLSTDDQQRMISSFLEIAGGEAELTAVRFLQVSGWMLNDAIELYYASGLDGIGEARATHRRSAEPAEKPVERRETNRDEVAVPLPVRREVLYANPISFRPPEVGYQNTEWASEAASDIFQEEMSRPSVWEAASDVISTAADSSRDNLASLYRAPSELMFQGTFDMAKRDGAKQDKWLLVNLQSNREFSSHMLNRDTWANSTVVETISSKFIFWQAYDETVEGMKVFTFYKLKSFPVVLVIDPITGQNMKSMGGMIEPHILLEYLLPFMDRGPKDNHSSLLGKRPGGAKPSPQKKLKDAVSLKVDASGAPNFKDDDTVIKEETCSSNKHEYPALPEEPKGDKSLLCRIGVRFPDGHRAQRSFLKTDPIQILWSFCYSQLGNGEKIRPFRLSRAIPGVSESLDYNSKLTFEESGLANSIISIILD